MLLRESPYPRPEERGFENSLGHQECEVAIAELGLLIPPMSIAKTKTVPMSNGELQAPKSTATKGGLTFATGVWSIVQASMDSGSAIDEGD